jgi:UDP-N-acetylglucosamine 2-epimerase (non-hydrolysing)
VTARAVLCVFGTRPEAIKMAPVVRAIAAVPDLVPMVCVTDQHRTMLDQVLDLFELRPDFRLDVMREGQSSTDVAARVLARLPRVLDAVRPAAVLVQGDTTTTVAAEERS